jgi:hypothetical protein
VNAENEDVLTRLKCEVNEFMKGFPLYPEL